VTACAIACHGSTSTVAATTTTPTTSQTPSSAVSVAPGSYIYRNAGLTVTLHLNGHDGSLVVDDQAGHDLGPPSIYVENAATGARLNGKVASAKPISDGANATFRVQFPSTVSEHDIGLVVLSFGGLNYGAMAPG
jgi:hypothetical protein